MIVSHNVGMEARNEQFNSGKVAIGTGLFRFVSWEPRGDLVVERFDLKSNMRSANGRLLPYYASDP